MTEWKPAKGWLEGKRIPKNSVGDPAFTELGELTNAWMVGEPGFKPEYTETSVLAEFTPEQVVYLVNKQLYALEYQRETHRKRAEVERETLAPVKKKVHELFGVSWIKATPEQVQKAMEHLKTAKENEEG